MLVVVLAGGSLERVAALAADDLGGTVAVLVPSAGVAVAWPPCPEPVLAGLRRYAGQRLEGEPAAVPDGLALELPVVSGRDGLGLVALLGANGPDAAADALHLAAAVAYRLDRVRELTGLNPFKQADRERLGLGLKARALLES